VSGAEPVISRSGRREQLVVVVRDRASPLFGYRERDVVVVAGRLDGGGGAVETVAEAMRRRPNPTIERRCIAGRDMGRSRFGRAAFGAQFAKVSVDPATLQVRVERLVGAFACGRIINPLIARSQLMGGMIWGLGQALLEESCPDPRTGRWTNANLAEALVPTNADTPDVEVILIEEDDTRGQALGVKGVGEIGVIGTAGAIANAIFNATGARLTSLPMRLNDDARVTRSAARGEHAGVGRAPWK
jgi:xanthine dehydrogenase YagR molybdenum-binding subunit